MFLDELETIARQMAEDEAIERSRLQFDRRDGETPITSACDIHEIRSTDDGRWILSRLASATVKVI